MVTPETDLRLANLHKKFGDTVAVAGIDLVIEEGEFTVLVGPSGCGKTTTLRIIAGLEQASSGDIYIGDQLVNDLPPGKRDVAMVFQNYSLYPHMKVWDNLAFGLKVRGGISREELHSKVDSIARTLQITHLLNRRPAQLSGGERQRVAIGRAMVRSPKIYLLDEPLSNLDAKLRLEMRAEIKRIHRQLGATTIYVTHDQAEAMSMADRLVVMRSGHIQQQGTPLHVYSQPQNMFVAQFIGSPGMNLVPGSLSSENGIIRFQNSSVNLPLPEHLASALLKRPIARSDDFYLGIRPEDIVVVSVDADECWLGKVIVVEFLGGETQALVQLGEHEIRIKTTNRTSLAPGDRIGMRPVLEKIHLFDGTSGLSLAHLPEKGSGPIEKSRREDVLTVS